MNHIQRRHFLGAVGGLFATSIARGQQVRKPTGRRRVGILELDGEEGFSDDSIKLRLRELGWVEGENIAFEYVFALGNKDRLRELAEDLVRKRVDLILALGPSEALAAARATRTIPVVFLYVQFPVEQGLVASHARPGRNVTGLADASGLELLVKRLELLKEIVPTAKRLSWVRELSLYLGTMAGGPMDLTAQETAVRKLGYQPRIHVIRKAEDLDAALADILAWHAQALTMSGVTAGTFTRIIEFALRHRIPSAGSHADFVLNGGLLSFHLDRDEHPRLSAEYLDHILRGARPADLPVGMPGKYQLYINLKTAKAIGVKIPPSILLRADRVIE